MDANDIEFLPSRFSRGSFLRGCEAYSGSMDIQGIGILTTVEGGILVDFKCKWEPYITDKGLTIVFFEFPNQSAYLVFAAKGFQDRIYVV